MGLINQKWDALLANTITFERNRFCSGRYNRKCDAILAKTITFKRNRFCTYKVLLSKWYVIVFGARLQRNRFCLCNPTRYSEFLLRQKRFVGLFKYYIDIPKNMHTTKCEMQ